MKGELEAEFVYASGCMAAWPVRRTEEGKVKEQTRETNLGAMDESPISRSFGSTSIPTFAATLPSNRETMPDRVGRISKGILW